ncbi:WS/DGAT/MGAT family O-acyltransferase [Roseiflexus castenholzii]|uniref:diacylglycerol O-acyltransferase n=1 Tax=Roseiflexus castenholzii (strain DSM 13941 / HLO8) TaxID=383372 RepID=A7NLS0_ROSCS|nr:wax ester/triacylglycerol synthase family O-acyltransferase [Roseiflexus castenholzii]ABU58468.1 Acyltransferase WS/DGAT/MGAT family protein [Roseiflexus castenholzii DSM 13941]
MAARRTEAFSSADTAWLRMEDPTNLMMITGVLMFDEPLDVARLYRVIEERLLVFDRFRMRVKPGRSPNALPEWEIDPYFNLHAHIHRIALPAPGGKRELQALVSDLMSTPLDFSKPLWHFHIVENYNGGSAALCRLHHAIADGIALVQVLLSLTDEQRDVPPAVGIGHGERNNNPVEAFLLPVVRSLSNALTSVGALVNESRELLEDPTRVIDAARTGVSGVQALNKLLFMPADPPTLFKGTLGVQKRAAWSDPIPLDEVRRVGSMFRCTINDVLLNAVAGALRRYLVSRGAIVDGLNIRAVVPVNLRPPGPITRLGNHFSLVFLDLPVGIEDPFDRLLELKRRMESIKGSPEAAIAFGILNTIGVMPQQMAELVVDIFGSKATAVMTNVPGPRQRIYLAGSPIRQIMFWVPQAGRLGLGVSIFSYAGDVLIGIAVDAGLVPDPDTIVEAFHTEFRDLLRLARIVTGGAALEYARAAGE